MEIRDQTDGELPEGKFERLLALQDAFFAEIDRSGLGIQAGDRLSRDEIYDRAALRAQHNES